jgi:hypothetical protein
MIAGCGSKTNPGSVCNSVGLSASAVCSETCDPNGANSCPSGYHCTGDGKCDAQCTQDGTFPCPDGYTCTADGTCQSDGSNGGTPDAPVCPAIHFTAMPTIPSIELLIDRSGSMAMSDISPTRYQAIETGLTGAQGVVTTDQATVYFGAAMFSGDQDPCLSLAGFTVPRALNNASAINTLLTAPTSQPSGSTPTADAVKAVTADFAANPPPMGSPPVILLSTDGEPNSCDGGNDNGASVAATKAAYAAGIRLFILGLALPDSTQFLQDMANAGAGVTAGMPNAPYFAADNPTQLATALSAIINGVLSCDLTITAPAGETVNPMTASAGTVTLDGMNLVFGTDWTVINGTTLELQGAACTKLKSDANPQLDASFPCGSIIQ